MLGGASTNPHAIVVLAVSSDCLLFTSPSHTCPEAPLAKTQNMNLLHFGRKQNQSTEAIKRRDRQPTLLWYTTLPLIPPVVGAPRMIYL